MAPKRNASVPVKIPEVGLSGDPGKVLVQIAHRIPITIGELLSAVHCVPE